MSESKGNICNVACWGASAAVALVVLLQAADEVPLLAALMAAGALAFLMGLALTRMLCLGKGLAPRAAGPAMALAQDGDDARATATPPAAQAPSPRTPNSKGEEPMVAAAPSTALATPEAKPDDLKKIKGIGPKLEAVCNTMGIFHFRQIAAWSPEDVAWMDDNLEGFRGRVTRDNWVAQAQALLSDTQTREKNHDTKAGTGPDDAP